MRRKTRGRATVEGILRYANDQAEFWLPGTKQGTYRMMYTRMPEWEDYMASSVIAAANRLERKGMVVKTETKEGIVVRITEKGKNQILKFELKRMVPLKDKWDGKWRLVFFDVAEVQRGRRDQLRRYLKQLGMEEMQESVFVSPYKVFNQVKYLREVLDIPHGVKLAELSWVENQEDLKEIFEP